MPVSWAISVIVSRWRNRLHYICRAPFVYKNWWAVLLPKLGTSIVLELRNGLRYLVRTRTTDLSVVNEASILDPYRLTANYGQLDKNSDVMDVGANIGDVTLRLARAFPGGRVFAIDPVPAHISMIKIQALLNDVSNIVPLQLALGDREGEIEINVAGSHSSIYWGKGTGHRTTLTTLPRLMHELGIAQLALLKLDCEGAEWEILPGAEEVLPRIDNICMEFHCTESWNAPKLAHWLRERGYSVQHTDGPWNGLLWASRTGLPLKNGTAHTNRA